ncbi:MAG: M14 family metallopeptidase [Planctomycetes bacterium]|nr:M14 family metallopeptidase [Planctomycetota bacterium]
MSPRAKDAESELLTRAERSDYKETSRHSDVIEFLRALAPKTDLLKIASMGRSAEGQDMPVVILSGARTFTPEEAHRRKKTIVMVIANIHAGEVEGKEACLMLARDLTTGRRRAFLDDLVLVLVPNYNPDGNDKVDPKNRALDLEKLDGQIGPEGGVGTRTTGQGINLNRDYMKMEAVESRHLSKLFGLWRPHVFVDCHTTDGSIHAYHLTFDTAHTLESGPREPILFARDEMLPEISRRLEKRTGHRTFFYGNWRDQNDPTKGWETYTPLPRYGSHYRGLTGRLDILLEAYSYIGFRERTDVMLAILLEIFQYVHENSARIRKIVERAERDTVERGLAPRPDDRVGINYGVAGRDAEGRLVFTYPAYPYPEPVEVMGWDLESLKARRIPGRKLAKFKALHYARFLPEISVRRPYAYLIPASCARVVEHLRLHNVAVEELAGNLQVPAEAYTILARESTVSPDVGTTERFETVFWVRAERAPASAHAGDFIVRTAQPSAHVAMYLLEPLSDDGFVRWNFFDELKAGDVYPIRRIPQPVELPAR